MNQITHRSVETNRLRMHIAAAGSGPLVLLLHGFPGLWYSWRHQLRAMDVPDLLVGDLRAFFRRLKRGGVQPGEAR